MDGGLDNQGVELRPGVTLQFVECVFDRLSLLIHTVADHGIEGVGYTQDAGQQRNPLTGAAEWIAQSVEAFVVGEYRPGDLRVNEAGHHLKTDQWVSSDEGRLIGVQASWERKNVGVDGGFADVVERCGDFEATNPLVVESEGVGDGPGQRADPSSVVDPLRGHGPYQIPNRQTIPHRSTDLVTDAPVAGVMGWEAVFGDGPRLCSSQPCLRFRLPWAPADPP